MRRATSRLRADLASRLDELERANPEWRPWIAMLREASLAPQNVATAASVRLAEPASAADLGADAPRLHGRTITVTPKPLLRFAQRLANAGGDAAGLDGFRLGEAEALQLIESTIRGATDSPAARSLGELLAGVVLSECGAALAGQVPSPWPHGYCPVCGAWPVLAELRGMDRARRLRCGRCASDWQMVWLRCAYCGEAEHERLMRLAPEGQLESRFVEACRTCGRYLKCLSTLTPLTPMELRLRDLETVELDLVALDRGYQRPQGPGFPVSARVVAEH